MDWLEFCPLVPPVPRLGIDDAVWDHSTFSKNRSRLASDFARGSCRSCWSSAA
jgi:hypothetical protein